MSDRSNCAIGILSAEQLLFHFTPERSADLSVISVISQWLVEALRDDRESPRCVEHTS